MKRLLAMIGIYFYTIDDEVPFEPTIINGHQVVAKTKYSYICC